MVAGKPGRGGAGLSQRPQQSAAANTVRAGTESADRGAPRRYLPLPDRRTDHDRQRPDQAGQFPRCPGRAARKATSSRSAGCTMTDPQSADSDQILVEQRPAASATSCPLAPFASTSGIGGAPQFIGENGSAIRRWAPSSHSTGAAFDVYVRPAVESATTSPATNRSERPLPHRRSPRGSPHRRGPTKRSTTARRCAIR